jgi:hypothetical protein
MIEPKLIWQKVGSEWHLYRNEDCLARLLPYDEPPKYIGWWVTRLTDAFYDFKDDYSHDIDFPSLDAAKACMEEWAVRVGLISFPA